MTDSSARRTGLCTGGISREDLRRAIDEEAFCLAYQPFVNLANGSVTGFEALLRWRDPQAGSVPAPQMVPIAVRYGMIRCLDDWALRTAARQLAAWQEDVLVAPGFRMAVNVTAAEMDGQGMVERVRRAIALTGVDPRGLVIEVTEDCDFPDVTAARCSADRLHALGVELALDDFGCAYSTFARLRSLPFDTLKIDRECTLASTSEFGEAFVRALVELGNHLGVRIVAEGIETPEQASRMRALGAHEGQGFLWAPALSVEEAGALLATGVWPSRAVSSTR